MRLLISLILLALCLTACGGNAAPEVGTAGQLVDWDNRCSEELNGQRLALEGIFSLNNSFSEGRNGTAPIAFRPVTPNPNHVLVFYISVGEGAGQVKAPPLSYELDDLEIRSSTGEVIDYQDLARVHFTLTYNGLNPAGNPTCSYDAPYLIESLATGDAEATEASE